MSSVNRCFFIGNLTRDVEIKFTPKGTACADIGIAMNEVYKDDAGTKHEKVIFVNLTAWGRTAEIAGEYLKKGRQAHFECSVTYETWTDKQSGQKRSKNGFKVDKLTLLSTGERRERSDDGGEPPEEREEPPPRKAYQKPPIEKESDLDEGFEEKGPF